MDVADRSLILWTKIKQFQWHHWARVVAFVVLVDQLVGPLSNLPSDTTIVVVSLGALFAPVPAERD